MDSGWNFSHFSVKRGQFSTETKPNNSPCPPHPAIVAIAGPSGAQIIDDIDMGMMCHIPYTLGNSDYVGTQSTSGKGGHVSDNNVGR